MQSITLEKCSGSASGHLKAQKHQILNQWIETVRVKQTFSKDELKVTAKLFTAFIDLISEIISTTPESTGGERHAHEVVELCRHYGWSRARLPGLTLPHIIQEYQLLREIILKELEAEITLSHLERRKLFESIDHGIVQASIEFSKGLSSLRIPILEEFKLRINYLQRKMKETKSEIEIHQTQILELKKSLRTLSIERDLRNKFVAALTHDLRTPLCSIRAIAEIALKRKVHPQLHDKCLNQICKDIDRMNDMIANLLDVSRICAGEKVPLKISQFDLRSLISSTLDELKTIYGDRFNFISYSSAIGFWDSSSIQRIIENLCNNAVKYGSPDSPITVTLKQNENRTEFSVHNFGPIMNPQEQASLFNPFQRLKTAQLSGKSGWGIGLTLAQGVAEAHGGMITVKSSAPNGTTFTVTLPNNSIKIKKSSIET